MSRCLNLSQSVSTKVLYRCLFGHLLNADLDIVCWGSDRVGKYYADVTRNSYTVKLYYNTLVFKCILCNIGTSLTLICPSINILSQPTILCIPKTHSDSGSWLFDCNVCMSQYV